MRSAENATPLTNCERSAMCRARQRARREGRTFHLDSELASYRSRVAERQDKADSRDVRARAGKDDQ